MSASNHDMNLTIADVAKIQQCSQDTVRRQIARGELKAYRFGRLLRIKPADLNKALRPVTNAAEMRGDLDA